MGDRTQQSADGSGATMPDEAERAEKKMIADLGILHTPKIPGDWTVDKVTATIPTGLPTTGSSSPLPYFHLLERLKTTKREGWRRFGIEHGESIADHMYRMSLLTMLAPPSLAPRLDLSRCMKMALVHDMAESLVGDITPVDAVPRAEKHAREAATMEYITKDLLGSVGGGVVGADLAAVWAEYEESVTLESQFVHDIDKMELLLQMMEYEKRAAGRLDLGEFAYVATKMVLAETKAWANELLAERDVFWEKQGHGLGEEGVKSGISVEHASMCDEYYEKDV